MLSALECSFLQERCRLLKIGDFQPLDCAITAYKHMWKFQFLKLHLWFLPGINSFEVLNKIENQES